MVFLASASWAWSSSTEVGIAVGAVTVEALLSLFAPTEDAGLNADERASPRCRVPIGSSLTLTEGAGPEFPGTTRLAAGVKCSSGDGDR